MVFIFTISPAHPELPCVSIFCASVCFLGRQEVKPDFELKEWKQRQELEGMFLVDKQNNRKIKFKAKSY